MLIANLDKYIYIYKMCKDVKDQVKMNKTCLVINNDIISVEFQRCDGVKNQIQRIEGQLEMGHIFYVTYLIFSIKSKATSLFHRIKSF